MLILKLLPTITIADLEQFKLKSKSITYTRVFVELYNWGNFRQVHEIYKIIVFEKIYI